MPTHRRVHGAVPPAGSFRTAARLASEDVLVRQVAGEGHVFSDDGEDLLWETALDWL